MHSHFFISQIISLLGAVLVLIAYIGHQAKWIHTEDISYHLLNILGSSVLAYVALNPLQIGFLITEGVWLTTSIITLFKTIQNKRKARKDDTRIER